MGKHTSTWKSVERTHAVTHGAPGRIGPTGLDMPDWVSDVEAGESKLMDTLPKWLKDAVEQSIINCERWTTQNSSAMERLPVVILHESGSEFTKDIVLIDHSFYLAWVLPALQHYWNTKPEEVIRVRYQKSG